MTHAHAPQPDIFGLLVRIMRAVKRVASTGPVDGPTLGVLWELSTRGPSRPSDLATSVALDASTVSRHLQTLERAGWVGRERDTVDGRARTVEVTDAGRVVLAEAATERAAIFAAALHTWDDNDRRTLSLLLDRLADDLADVLPPTDGRTAPYAVIKETA